MWHQFELGFWHPFGAYAGQSALEVLEVKSREIEGNGWTFWSFAHSPTAVLWLEQLAEVKGPVLALCSHSPNARDPDTSKGARVVTHYRQLQEQTWQPMPDRNLLKVTNPFRRRGLALGFKVRRVIPITPGVPPLMVEWFSRTKQAWSTSKVPTRGEFLIRRGGGTATRAVCAILELAPPYLVELRHDQATVGA